MARVTIAGVTVAAVLAFPGTALADATIQATDGVLPDGSDNRWTPPDIAIQVGEIVTWSFAGTKIAHIASNSPNWSYSVPHAVAGDPGKYTFTAPGYYAYYCELHKSPMRGTITVGDPPPPPPPPLSEQPFVNDFPAPTVLEVRDEVAPKLDRISVKRVRGGARVTVRS
jgi:plastocyanin